MITDLGLTLLISTLRLGNNFQSLRTPDRRLALVGFAGLEAISQGHSQVCVTLTSGTT